MMQAVTIFVAELFGLCGYGKEENWSVKVADWFFVDCGCCWFWRGVMLGASSSVLLALLLVPVILYIGSL